MIVTLCTSDLRVEVRPDAGGRIAQITMGETPILLGAESPEVSDPVLGWGCFPMVPWAGRLRGATFPWRGKYVKLPREALRMEGPHALHGTCTNHPWNVVAQSASSMVMRIELEETGWPFGGWAEQRISLSPTSVQMEMSVHSEKTEFPAQIGWHPWFATPEWLDVDFSTMHRRDTEGIATAELVEPAPPPWDDCFTGALHAPRLRVNGLDLELTSDCSHWVVYNPPTHGVCIEPQSGPPDMFNMFSAPELGVVAPGRPLTRHFIIAFRGRAT